MKRRIGTKVERFNSRFNPVKKGHIGEVRELVDQRGRVGFLGKIIKVSKDKVIYKIIA